MWFLQFALFPSSHFRWPLLVSCLLRCPVSVLTPPLVPSSVLSCLPNLCDCVSLWPLLHRCLSAGRPTATRRRNPCQWPTILCRQFANFARTNSLLASLVSAHGLTINKGMKMAVFVFLMYVILSLFGLKGSNVYSGRWPRSESDKGFGEGEIEGDEEKD